jgi:hypothetical protein
MSFPTAERVVRVFTGRESLPLRQQHNLQALRNIPNLYALDIASGKARRLGTQLPDPASE